VARIAGVAAVLVVLFVGAAAVVVPRLAAGDAVRQRLADAVREATGREFVYGELRAGLLPPRVELVGARVAGPTPDAPPFLEAERVAVRLSLLPLVVRVVAADPLVLEGVTLRVERRADGGFSWPRRSRKEREKDAEKEPEMKEPRDEPRPAGRRTEFVFRTLELRDVRVLMEGDRGSWVVAAGEGRGRAMACGSDRFAVDLEVMMVELDVAETRARGDLLLQADLRGRKGAGAYRLDATHSDVLFRGYRKPDETPAVFSLNLRREKGRYAWDAPALELFGEPLGTFRNSPCDEELAP
jgi:hypothetical protein